MKKRSAAVRDTLTYRIGNSIQPRVRIVHSSGDFSGTIRAGRFDVFNDIVRGNEVAEGIQLNVCETVM
jgi:hypothetical protein